MDNWLIPYHSIFITTISYTKQLGIYAIVLEIINHPFRRLKGQQQKINHSFLIPKAPRTALADFLRIKAQKGLMSCLSI